MVYFDLENYIHWEKSLKIGDLVEARFTNNFNYYHFTGRITKINRMSMRVATIQNNIPYRDDHAGKQFVFPRYLANIWSRNNGIFPIKYKSIR